MRTLVRFMLVSVLSAMCGGFVAWHFFLHQIQARVIPFDRSIYDKFQYDWSFYEPMINFEVDGTNRVYWFSRPEKRKSIDTDLAKELKRLSGIDTNIIFYASVNPNVSIKQVGEITTMFCEAGLPSPKFLIEENRGAKKGRRFKELRLGPNAQFEWYLKEWLIESKQEQACKNMKNRTKKPAK